MEQEEVLEVGLVLLAVGLLVGAGALLASRTAGTAQRRRRQGQSAPAAGSVPAERHQHIGTASAR